MGGGRVEATEQLSRTKVCWRTDAIDQEQLTLSILLPQDKYPHIFNHHCEAIKQN